MSNSILSRIAKTFSLGLATFAFAFVLAPTASAYTNDGNGLCEVAPAEGGNGIQLAVDDLSCSTIELTAGFYPFDSIINIERPIIIKGAVNGLENTSILRMNSNSANIQFEIGADGSTLQNLDIYSLLGTTAVYVQGANNVTVTGNNFVNFEQGLGNYVYPGIRIVESTGTSVTNCGFSRTNLDVNYGDGITIRDNEFDGEWGTGIAMHRVDNSVIEGNRFYGTSDLPAIYLNIGFNNTIGTNTKPNVVDGFFKPHYQFRGSTTVGNTLTLDTCSSTEIDIDWSSNGASHDQVNPEDNTVVVANPADGICARRDEAVTFLTDAVVVDVLTNDYDTAGDTLSISTFTQAVAGTVTQNGSNLTFTAYPGFVGIATFEYTVSDGTNQSDPVQVSVYVQNENCSVDASAGLSGIESALSTPYCSVIYLGEGTFYLPVDSFLTIERRVEIRGASTGAGTKIVHRNSTGSFSTQPTGAFFLVTRAIGSVIRNIEFVSDYQSSVGITLDTANVTIANNEFSGYGQTGIYINSGDYSTIVGNEFSGDLKYGIYNYDINYFTDNYSGNIGRGYDGSPAEPNIMSGPFNQTINARQYQINVGVGDTVNVYYDLCYTNETDIDNYGGLALYPVWPSSGICAIQDDALTLDTTPVTIDVLANDIDQDSDTLTVAGFTQPASGTVVKNADETLTYTANTGFLGSDEFTYTATDGTNISEPAKVTVEVFKQCDVAASEGLSGINSALADPLCGFIQLGAGTFEFGSSYLSIDRKVVIKGSGSGTTLRASNTVIRVFSGNTTITDLTLENYNGSSSTNMVQVYGGQKFTFANNVLKGSGSSGLWVSSAVQKLEVYGNTVLANLNYGFLFNTASNYIGTNEGLTLVSPNYMPGEFSSNQYYLNSVSQANTYLYYDACGTELTDIRLRDLNDFALIEAVLPASGICTRPDSAETFETAPVTIDVLANDFGSPGDTLTVAGFTQSANGTVVKNADETLTYTADVGFRGNETFTYTVTNGTFTSDPVLVSITVFGNCAVAASEGYTGLNAAVNDPTCRIISLGEGTFDIGFNNLTVDRLVTIQGATTGNGTTIKGGNYNIYLIDGSDGSTVRNIRIEGISGSARGIYLYEVEDITITGVTFSGLMFHGVYAVDNVRTTITDNVFEAEFGNGYGIRTSQGEDSVIEDNEFSGNMGYGIYTFVVNGGLVVGNEFSGNMGYGIRLERSGNLSIGYNPELDLVSLNIMSGSYSTAPYSSYINNYGGSHLYYDACVTTSADYGTGWTTLVPVFPSSGICAIDDSVSTTETQPVVIDALANDLSAQGNPLSVNSFTQPVNGNVSKNTDDTFTYIANIGYRGLDVFDYTVTDGTSVSDPGTVSVFVGGVCAVAASEGYTGLNAAVNDPTCAIIELGEGFFYLQSNTLNVSRKVIIRGAATGLGTTLNGSGGNGIIHLDAGSDGSTIEGVRFFGTNIYSEMVYIDGSSGNTITDNIFSGPYMFAAVYLSNADNNIVSNNLVTTAGINGYVHHRYNFYLNYSDNNSIFGNVVSNETHDDYVDLYPVFVRYSNDNQISDNEILVRYSIGMYLYRPGGTTTLAGNSMPNITGKHYSINYAYNNPVNIEVPCTDWTPNYESQWVYKRSSYDVNVTQQLCNLAPVAADDNYGQILQAHDTLIPIADLLANDYDPNDPDAPGSIADPTTAPEWYTLTLLLETDRSVAGNSVRLIEEDGVKYVAYLHSDFTYTGVDTFEYTVCDGGNPNLCDSAEVTIETIPAPTGGINLLYERHYTGSGKAGQKHPQADAEVHVFDRDCAQPYGLKAEDYADHDANCERIKVIRYTNALGRTSFGVGPGDYLVHVIDIDEDAGVYQAVAEQVSNVKDNGVKSIALQGVLDPTLSRDLLGIQRGKSGLYGLRGSGTVIYRQSNDDASELSQDGILELNAFIMTKNATTGDLEAVPSHAQAKIYTSDDTCLSGKTSQEAYETCMENSDFLNVPPQEQAVEVVYEPGSYKLIARSLPPNLYTSLDFTIGSDVKTTINIKLEDVDVVDPNWSAPEVPEDDLMAPMAPVTTVLQLNGYTSQTPIEEGGDGTASAPAGSGDGTTQVAVAETATLETGDSLWSVVADASGSADSNTVSALAKIVAEDNGIAVPEWGIGGLTLASEMQTGAMVDLSSLQAWLAAN